MQWYGQWRRQYVLGLGAMGCRNREFPWLIDRVDIEIWWMCRVVEAVSFSFGPDWSRKHLGRTLWFGITSISDFDEVVKISRFFLQLCRKNGLILTTSQILDFGNALVLC